MARTGQYITDGAWIIAQDAGKPGYGFAIGDTPGIRWSPEEALRWINDVQVEIVSLLPRANAVRALVTVEEGTRQTAAGLGLNQLIAFVDVPRNFSAAGEVGSPITKRDRAYFDDARPNWHSDEAAEALHWMSDPEDPKAIWLWPAVTGAGKIEVVHSAVPADLADLEDPIGLADEYANALMYGLLSRFYMKDATYGKNPQVAASFGQLMREALGLRATNGNNLEQGATKRSAGT